MPIGGLYERGLFLGVFEVVDIGGSALNALRLHGHELGDFGIEGDLGGGGGVDEGNLVDEIGEPLGLVLP